MTSSAPLTILIPAKDAGPTVRRAVTSALQQGAARILLIDHASSDDTVDIARRAGAGRLDVLCASADETLGAVRSLGLDAVETEFGMWLDADDELLPGRGECLVGRLQSEQADLAFDEADLHDGASGVFVRRLSIPAFLHGTHGVVRLFERNYLPAPGVPAFRTRSAKAIAFDGRLHGAEDLDFLLRAVGADLKITLEATTGYRQFAYPATLSRNRENQARMLRAALQKHDPSAVAALFTRAGYDARQTAWGLVSFLIFRGDLSVALTCLDRLDGLTIDRGEIAEPNGPAPFPEGWRLDFHRGTLLAAMGGADEAARLLRRAVEARAAPEALNNLGVVLVALGRPAEGAALFAQAARGFPGYSDAAANLHASLPARLTLHPLRREPGRNEYE